ncbi:MAG: cupin domain-containing protein [Robiginitomaculum sp.]
MSIIDKSKITSRRGTGYPAPFDAPCKARAALNLGDHGGLTQFGAHLITLPPGAWSSQRHWHNAEDEFVMIASGRPTLVDNNGEQELAPGDCTAHPAGEENAHHMINKTDTDVTYLVIGTRAPQNDSCAYPDIDMALPSNGTSKRVFTRKNGDTF